MLFTSLYLFYSIGYFYSENKDYAQTDLLLKIPLLLFPIIISTSFVKDKTTVLLKTFLWAALVSAVFCVARSGYLTYSTGENYFYYYKLSWFFHVGNYSMYLVFATFIALYFLFSEKNTASPTLQLFYISVFVFFSVVIILLSARAQIVAFFAVLFCAALYYLLKKENRLKGLMLLFSLAIILTVAIFLVPGTKGRFKTTHTELIKFLGQKKTEDYQSYLRLSIWQTGMKVIREHPVFGVGTGDAKDKLLEQAKRKNYRIIVKKNLNYHNQFLQTMAAIGLPGLFALLLSIAAGIAYSLHNREFLTTAFFIIITISFFTESMLERQAGVIFYSFFSAILIFADNEKNEEFS